MKTGTLEIQGKAALTPIAKVFGVSLRETIAKARGMGFQQEGMEGRCLENRLS